MKLGRRGRNPYRPPVLLYVFEASPGEYVFKLGSHFLKHTSPGSMGTLVPALKRVAFWMDAVLHAGV